MRKFCQDKDVKVVNVIKTKKVSLRGPYRALREIPYFTDYNTRLNTGGGKKCWTEAV